MSRDLYKYHFLLGYIMLCNISWICTSTGWSVSNFPNACKVDNKSEKIMTLLSWDWYVCLRAIKSALQLHCVHRTLISLSTWEGAIWGNWWHCFSSNLLIDFGAVGKNLNIVLVFWCYLQKSLFIDYRVCAVLFCFVCFLTLEEDRQTWGSDGF